MRSHPFVALAAFLALCLPASAAAQDKEFKGRITDDMCGATHMMEGMTDQECADECVKGGAQYALHVPGEDKVYALDKQAEAQKFSAASVIVRGRLGPDGKSIVVTSIEKDKTPKKP